MATANKKLLDNYKDLLDIQLSDGNWNANPYMHGMANGMILMNSMARDIDPDFKTAPEYWRKRIPMILTSIRKTIWPLFLQFVSNCITNITGVTIVIPKFYAPVAKEN